jgi:hypothetical protein
MNNDLLTRLAALEARMAVLESAAGIAKPATRPAPAARLVEPEGVRVTHPLAGSFTMPSTDEGRKLLAIAQARLPKHLKPDFSRSRLPKDEEHKFLKGFEAALLYVGSLGRQEQLNTKVSVSWWIDGCEEFLRERNISADVGAAQFAAACLCCGVGYVPHDAAQGVVWTFALVVHGGQRMTADSWRAILRAGQIREPLPASSRSPYPAPEARITVTADG